MMPDEGNSEKKYEGKSFGKNVQFGNVLPVIEAGADGLGESASLAILQGAEE